MARVFAEGAVFLEVLKYPCGASKFRFEHRPTSGADDSCGCDPSLSIMKTKPIKEEIGQVYKIRDRIDLDPDFQREKSGLFINNNIS